MARPSPPFTRRFAPIRANLKPLLDKGLRAKTPPKVADRFGEITKGGSAACARPCGASARRGAPRLLRRVLWYTRVPMDRPGQLVYAELPHPAHRAPRGVEPTA